MTMMVVNAEHSYEGGAFCLAVLHRKDKLIFGLMEILPHTQSSLTQYIDFLNWTVPTYFIVHNRFRFVQVQLVYSIE